MWACAQPNDELCSSFTAQAQGRTGQYRTGQDEPLMQADGTPGDISVQDLAVALVDALDQHLHSRARYTVAY